ncbi:MAG: hypothetical protein U0T82_04195 [Bacteroidales bacterium]
MIQKLFKNISLIFISLILFTCCTEIKTDNAVKTYRYWGGTDPTEDIGLINGHYWQSSHFTKEYIMYLKIKPTKQWLESFITQNQLVIDKRNWTIPDDAPTWFKPSDNSLRYSDGKDFNQGTRLFVIQYLGFTSVMRFNYKNTAGNSAYSLWRGFQRFLKVRTFI